MDIQTKQKTIDYRRYLRLVWRHKWLALLPTVLFPLTAGFYAMQIKDSFSSTTLILVTPQKVPTNFVPSTVTTGIQERLQTISQQIFSRTRLEQIITEFDLFSDEKEKLTPEEVIELMRRKISLKVQKNNSFTLSFVDTNPRMAMLVTNKLASLFIQENLKVREQQAVGTSQFLGGEIDRYRELVRDKEKIIFEFKQRHIDEMPEQLNTNTARLSQLQRQLEINNLNLNAAKDRRVQLQHQVAEIERRLEEEYEAKLQEARLAVERGAAAVSELEPIFSPIKMENIELAKLKEELVALRLTRTDQHPDVVKLKAKIKALENEDAKAKKEQGEGSNVSEELKNILSGVETETKEVSPEDSAKNVVVPKPVPPPIYSTLKMDLAVLETELSRINAQNEDIGKKIEKYQERIAATPARELELKELSEDYNSLKAVLENLVDKKIQADLSENLERKQKGEQFKILDPANLPEKPFAPNRVFYLAFGIFLGFAIGPGIIVLIDFLNPGIKSRQDLSSSIDAPVLVLIPEIITKNDRKKVLTLRWSATAGFLFVIAIGLLVVHLKYKPIPKALGDMATQIKTTHWSNMK